MPVRKALKKGVRRLMGKLAPAENVTLPSRPQSSVDVGLPVPIPTANMSSISMPPGLPGGDTVGESSTRASSAAPQLPQTLTDKPAGEISVTGNDAAISTIHTSAPPAVCGSGKSEVSPTTTPTQCSQTTPQTRSEPHSSDPSSHPEATATAATDEGTSLPNEVRESTISPAVKTTGIQSLWIKAINNPELSTQERKVIAEIGIETDTIQISLSLGAMMEDILKKQKGKEWKVKFRGDDIVLGHIGMKILHWVDKFKEIGDIIMQFDPVHAALPWAGFRYLLKVELSRASTEHQTNRLVHRFV